ncbi:skin secretory protein xP2-like [Serinus canaria]|uniref:skin secretory protein xP2-like n=1 Tax=Serinus canaria TaxID=9135 RepID=UPI0021CD0CCF|nr:skin secretory protein xP2-like [Serinus canaria]
MLWVYQQRQTPLIVTIEIAGATKSFDRSRLGWEGVSNVTGKSACLPRGILAKSETERDLIHSQLQLKKNILFDDVPQPCTSQKSINIGQSSKAVASPRPRSQPGHRAALRPPLQPDAAPAPPLAAEDAPPPRGAPARAPAAAGRPGPAPGARRLRGGGGARPRTWTSARARGPSRAAAEQLRGGAAAGAGGSCGGVPAPSGPARWQEAAGSPGEGRGRHGTPGSHAEPTSPLGLPVAGEEYSFVPACPRVCECPEQRRGRLGPGAAAVRAAVSSPSPRAPLDAAGRGAGPASAGNAGSPSPPSRSAGARAAGGGSPSVECGASEGCPRRGTAAELSPLFPARGTGRPQPRVPVPSPREQRAAAGCGLLRFIQALVMPG